jgi:hypothetical protein
VSPAVGAEIGSVIQPGIVDAQKKFPLGDEFAMQRVSIVKVMPLPLHNRPNGQQQSQYQKQDSNLQSRKPVANHELPHSLCCAAEIPPVTDNSAKRDPC